ncbi:MAG: hypothetical protein Fur002_01170 [Anaerolineales bacterium]
MVNERAKQENQMPAIDEGWWDSVLAEESRFYSPAPEAARAKPAPSNAAALRQPAEKLPPADWHYLKNLYMQDKIVSLLVTGINRGGLLVEGDGLYGFVPASHLIELAGKPEDDSARDLKTYIGKTLRLKVIECAPEDGRVVFSERAAQSEAGKRTKIFSSLQPGQTAQGIVTNITDFGVFVDLGGVEGLIHISELSWGRVLHPSQFVQLGETIQVQVLELSSERCRVALSLKRLQPNPWERALQDFPEGSAHNATITSVLSYGAFARLDAGVEGLIHASEIPNLNGASVKDFLSEGQRIQARVLHLDPQHQRLGLSMRLE